MEKLLSCSNVCVEYEGKSGACDRNGSVGGGFGSNQAAGLVYEKG